MKKIAGLIAAATGMLVGGTTGATFAEGHETAPSAPPYYMTIHGAAGQALNDYDFFAPTSNAAQPLNGDVDIDGAFVIGVSAGMFLDDNWRVGGEINYSSLDPDSMFINNLGGGLLVTLDGDVNNISVMIDAAYEVQVNDMTAIFFEAGVGIIHADVDNVQTGPGFNGFIDDSDTALSAKVGVGATYRLNEDWELFGEYNFVFGEDFDLQFTAPGAALNPVPFELENQTHVGLFGVRKRF